MALDLSDALWMQDDGDETCDLGRALTVLATFERNKRRRWRWMFGLAERTVELVQKPEIAANIEKVTEALLDTPTIEGDRLKQLLAPIEGKSAPRAVRA